MNRKLFKSIREYKRESILAPVFVILEVLMEVLIPLQMAKIIDVGIQNGDLTYIMKMGAILVVMAMLALFFGAMAGKFAAVAAAGYAKNLRHDIFYKIQDFSFKNIDHFSTSSLVTRLTTDITNVQLAYMMSVRLLARAPIMIILSLVMILTVYSRFFKLYMATAIAPIPLASFAGQPSSSIGAAFLKSYAAICLEGCVIVLACVIFSAFASAPPAITDSTLAPATIVWNYVGELIFNMLVLVGAIKMSDRLIRELMGLG